MQNIIEKAAFSSKSLTDSEINVGASERTMSLVSGAALVGYGLIRRGILGTGSMLLGAALLDRGARGHCEVYHLLGMNTARGAFGSLPGRLQGGIEYSITIDAPIEELSKRLALPEELSALISGTNISRRENIAEAGWSKPSQGPVLQVRITEITPDRIEWTVADRLSGRVLLKKAPGSRGTEIRLELGASRPNDLVNRIATWLARMQWRSRIRTGLRQLKQEIEAHEVPTTVGQPAGRERGRDTTQAMTLAEVANKV